MLPPSSNGRSLPFPASTNCSKYNALPVLVLKLVRALPVLFQHLDPEESASRLRSNKFADRKYSKGRSLSFQSPSSRRMFSPPLCPRSKNKCDTRLFSETCRFAATLFHKPFAANSSYFRNLCLTSKLPSFLLPPPFLLSSPLPFYLPLSFFLSGSRRLLPLLQGGPQRALHSARISGRPRSSSYCRERPRRRFPSRRQRVPLRSQ